jgi:hydroxyacylglutathione hydrolase
MTQQIIRFKLALPFRLGPVNCYLVKQEAGCFLIDTGSPNIRRKLERQLEHLDCKPGQLKLIVLTHGDFDHTGNAAQLKEKFGARVCMHADDCGMVETGNMFWNRKNVNPIVKMVSPLLFGFGKSRRFTPDFCIEDGDSLKEYGLDAYVISLPGHSKGSVGILTANGDLFCGDLLDNIKQPGVNQIMDDQDAARQSIEKLGTLEINRVYPGHGEPFLMSNLLENV